MKKGKQVGNLIALTSMSLMLLAGCSAKTATTESPKESSTSATAAASTAPAKEEKVELTMAEWGTADQVKDTQTILNVFMQKNPNIKVNLVYKDWGSYWTWITTQAASKDLPDVYKMSFAYVDKYAKLGAMKPLDDLIKSTNFNLGDFEQPLLDMHKSGGKQVSLPRDANTVVMYYNKDIFDKAKLKYPDKEMTWDQVVELAKKLTVDEKGNTAADAAFDSGHVKQWGILADPAGMADAVLEPQLWSNGARMVDDSNKLALETPEAKQVLQFFQDLTTKQHVNPPASVVAGMGGNQILAFGTGKIAMAFAGSWSAVDIKAANVKFDSFLPPKFKEVKTVVQPAGYALSPNSKKEKAAWTLLSWLTGPEGQIEMAKLGNAIPANKKAGDTYLKFDQGFDKKIFLEAQSKAIPAPWYEGKDRLLWEYIPQKLQLPLQGKGNVDAAIKEITGLMNNK
ncbi:ABC transporter substrate-binding protein [Paenibacillus sp. GCM10027628]|uniref:ABC transporter substrate-binding protein n=1 Tax=Paenibacillus sp. GCM10027628 TaxID=3273413 RepID=UPI00363837F7